MKTSFVMFVFGMALLASLGSAMGQSWRWGKRGGDAAIVGMFGTPDGVADMATDKWGNVYVIAKVFGTGYDVDGHSETGYGNNDVCIASFNCNGGFRWSKTIGASNIDQAVSIRTDTLGGVYIAGSITGTASYGHVHIDADTTLAYTNKSMYLLKYDTGGVYKWLRLPQADTVLPTTTTNSGSWDMDVDGAGNIALLCNLAPGGYNGGAYVVAAQSLHVLSYSASGAFTAGVRLDVTYSSTEALVSLRMAKDYARGRYYLVGAYNMYVGTTYHLGATLIQHEMYAGCFGSTGANIWTKQCNDTLSSGGFDNRPLVDAAGNVYMVGNTRDHVTFNGHLFASSLGLANYSFPVLLKLDTAGNNIWVGEGGSNAVSFGSSVALSGGTVAINGSYPGKLKFGTAVLNSPAGTGYRQFIARFNTADGTVLGLDSLVGTGYASALAADRKGNFYLGGQFAGVLYAAHDTLHNAGGEYDFSIVKYGYDNCSCTATPVAAFTHTGSPVVTCTYTGTTVAVDSITWSFGDGGHDTGMHPTHTYAATGVYNLCVTVHSACGSDVHCSTVTIATSGIAAATAGDVLVYPNPATEQLYIEHAGAGSMVRLLNMLGQQVYGGTVTSDRHTISMHSLPAGSYLLQVADADGNRMTKTIVKE